MTPKGRPPVGDPPKRKQINHRVSEELYNQLELAAQKCQRSISEEITFRLEISFLIDHFLADPGALKRAVNAAKLLHEASSQIRRARITPVPP